MFTTPELRLRDSKNQMLIGPPRTADDEALFVAGATSMIYLQDGTRWGIYVDDTTPGRDTVAAVLAGRMPLDEKVVIGIKPGEYKHRVHGCISALEWYPWAYHFYPYNLLPAQAYIFAKYFKGDGRRPWFFERKRLYAKAMKHNPLFVWWY